MCLRRRISRRCLRLVYVTKACSAVWSVHVHVAVVQCGQYLFIYVQLLELS